MDLMLWNKAMKNNFNYKYILGIFVFFLKNTRSKLYYFFHATLVVQLTYSKAEAKEVCLGETKTSHSRL